MDAELRLQDFALEDYQEMISDSFRDFFEKECPSSLVRETEAAGYAPGLWKQLVGMGAVSMGLPAEVGGDGSSLVDLTLVAEEAGSVMAPVPLIAFLERREAELAFRELAEDDPDLEPSLRVERFELDDPFAS